MFIYYHIQNSHLSVFFSTLILRERRNTMKTGIKHLIILSACLSMFLIAFSGCDKKTAPTTTEKPVISDGERALAWTEVQNTMSKHGYYHGAGKHLDELNDIWVREDGEFGNTATWTNPQGVQEGMALIKKNYATKNTENQQKTLDALSKIFPEVKNSPENLGVGSLVVHTQTTPVIEIAGDGNTAKGIWYSPGMSLNAEVKDGKLNVSGNWFWEKYAADFVKEDGRWKIWHIQMYYDLTPGFNTDWTKVASQPTTDRAVGKDKGEPEAQSAMSLEMSKPNPKPYKSWSPTTVPSIMPRFPEPYYTFSETFSY
jgi:hypothetical protein